jgi:hypothetical protein
MTEYGFIVQTIEIKPEADDADSNEVGKSMAIGMNQFVQKAARSLPNLRGGGWEIASHSLTRVGKHMIISLLIRREKPATP